MLKRTNIYLSERQKSLMAKLSRATNARSGSDILRRILDGCMANAEVTSRLSGVPIKKVKEILRQIDKD